MIAKAMKLANTATDMDKIRIINDTILFVKQTLSEAEGGHDWWHIHRVWNTAKTIATQEDADLFVVELGALLHDIADSKFHNGDESIGPKRAKAFLERQGVDERIIAQVVHIVKNISFRGGYQHTDSKSIELSIVQDADRLDAMGAIGIARAFNYGGFKNRKLYDPEVPPKLNKSKEEYKQSTDPTINHFYEKLFLLKHGMNTKTGRELAEKRHAFMEEYIEQFYAEWQGSR